MYRNRAYIITNSLLGVLWWHRKSFTTKLSMPLGLSLKACHLLNKNEIFRVCPSSHTETAGDGHQLTHNPDKAGKENRCICDYPLLYLWNLQTWFNHYKSAFSALYPHVHMQISVNNPGKHRQEYTQKSPYSTHIWNIKASISAICE